MDRIAPIEDKEQGRDRSGRAAAGSQARECIRMELPLALLALAVAIGALAVALSVRRTAVEVSASVGASQDAASRREGDLASSLAALASRVEGIQAELGEVRAGLEPPPPPPLPRARTGRLDDLREQLRATQNEAESDDE